MKWALIESCGNNLRHGSSCNFMGRGPVLDDGGNTATLVKKLPECGWRSPQIQATK